MALFVRYHLPQYQDSLSRDLINIRLSNGESVRLAQ